jgi:hypothetical protein
VQSGCLSASLGNAPSLSLLFVADNELSGTIPDTLSHLMALWYVL